VSLKIRKPALEKEALVVSDGLGAWFAWVPAEPFTHRKGSAFVTGMVGDSPGSAP
jgi:hypothetical protein